MGNKVIVCGINGARKSTLGKRLAKGMGRQLKLEFILSADKI